MVFMDDTKCEWLERAVFRIVELGSGVPLIWSTESLYLQLALIVDVCGVCQVTASQTRGSVQYK